MGDGVRRIGPVELGDGNDHRVGRDVGRRGCGSTRSAEPEWAASPAVGLHPEWRQGRE